MIELYSFGTPNGQKISIMLEETGLPYHFHMIDIRSGEQKTPEFLTINPNGKIPAIVDRDGPDGEPVTIFESGAILIYLAEKSGMLLPKEAMKRFQVLEWMFFQAGGTGPMFGQVSFFKRAKEPNPAALERYTAEAYRLLGVLRDHLADREYLAAGEYTIADIMNWSWVNATGFLGLDLEPYPAVRRWLERISSRPAVARGLLVGKP